MSVHDRRTRHTDLDSGTALWVSHNIHKLEEIPEPGREWTSDEPGFDHSLVTKLLHEGLIERVSGKGSAGGRRYYRTKPEAYEAVQTFAEDSDKSDRLLPCPDPDCPAKGFVTTSEGLECKYCGEIHDKEVIR